MKKPNLFEFATSELSQDAFFAWLMSWADDKYSSSDKDLNHLAKKFIGCLSGWNDVNRIHVGRQWQNIDVWAEVNDDAFLMIEDKTGTSIHDDQLQRYKTTVENHYDSSRQKLAFAYVKTGNEPIETLKEIRKAGYRTISRKDIIDVLDQYKGNNQIILDYRERLHEIEDWSSSYVSKNVKQWGWHEWQGFYMFLETICPGIYWGYVANPSGGFQGAWWYFRDNDQDGQCYLQFEQDKFCFKISCESDDRRTAREEMYHRLMEASRNGFPEIKRPPRFGNGSYMTIGVVDFADISANGDFNAEAIETKMRCYERIVDRICNTASSILSKDADSTCLQSISKNLKQAFPNNEIVLQTDGDWPKVVVPVLLDGKYVNFAVEISSYDRRIYFGINHPESENPKEHKRLTEKYLPLLENLDKKEGKRESHSTENWPAWRYTSRKNATARLIAFINEAMALV